ncbi:Farnesyl pyrophosphate synthase [Orchesella cincta]|uniref:Farnesyl pyrophosphate synthase n=1 Tax=Orchesella cincta TaxID=48709 RepID=A0A1D2MI06_ORCCI|nr:Farnesyl pyrophosphate synthase [Orchesella cincta]
MVETTFVELVKEDHDNFNNLFKQIVDDIISDTTTFSEENQLSSALSWIGKVCIYNVPHGKKLRGLLVPLTVRVFLKNPTNIQLNQAYVLGWCVEILQAAFLVADDIMDKGIMRRGSPCWYLVDNLGADAVNDSWLLEQFVYQLVRKHFGGTSYYTNLIDLFHQVTQKTVLGQCLDTQTGRNLNFEEYTMERYETIVKYKTSYYTFYLPIALATIIATAENKLANKLEALTMNIGHLFQAVDDYLDCFGSEMDMGKVGTDIQNGKCSWLFVRSKQLCSKEQLGVLYENYGNSDNDKVAQVKKIYECLNITQHFEQFVQQKKGDFLQAVEELENNDLKVLLQKLLEMVVAKV